MAADAQHRQVAYRPPEIEHRYGAGVHLLADPVALTLLGRLCEKGVVQPEVSRLIAELYRTLAHVVVAAELPRRAVTVATRMIDATPLGTWSGEAVADDTPAVVVALARAGLVPASVTYDFLHQLVRPELIRQDHLFLGRATDADGRVTGAALAGAKIGGLVEQAVMLIPDPMGATGNTIDAALRHYDAIAAGTARKIIAMHLIVTPEYLRLMRARHPRVVIYAWRLDRGLSPPDVLETIPGSRWDEERGLTDHDYIVPGGGGLGEVLTNSFV